MRRKVMAFALSAALVGAFALAGCSQAQSSNAPAPSSPAQSNEAAQQTTTAQQPSPSEASETEGQKMKVTINGTAFTATLADNSSAKALAQILADGPKTYTLQDYAGMEKVGSLGTNLPTNDQQITTEAGDIILYQGSMLVIYYAPNSWNFTRLGKIDNVDAQQLIDAMGAGSVEVTLSL